MVRNKTWKSVCWIFQYLLKYLDVTFGIISSPFLIFYLFVMFSTWAKMFHNNFILPLSLICSKKMIFVFIRNSFTQCKSRLLNIHLNHDVYMVRKYHDARELILYITTFKVFGVWNNVQNYT